MQLERIFSYLFGSIFLLSVFQAIKNAHPARREPDERVGQRAGFSVLLRAGILPGAAGFLRAACLLFGAFSLLGAALLHAGSRSRRSRGRVLSLGQAEREHNCKQSKSEFLHDIGSFYGLGF